MTMQHDDAQTGPDRGSPLSWRDVYRAVEQSEKRIIEAVNAAVQPLSDTSKDHEQRIRRLEQEGSQTAREALRMSLALGVKYDVVDEQLNAFTNREKGIFQTLSSAQKTILLLAACMSALLALQHFLEPFLTGGTP